MISQFNIIIATIIILLPFTQQLHKNNDNDNSDADDNVAKKATKKGSTSTDWLRNRELYVRQIDAITGSTHPRIKCVLYIEMTPPTAIVLSLSRALDACVGHRARGGSDVDSGNGSIMALR